MSPEALDMGGGGLHGLSHGRPRCCRGVAAEGRERMQRKLPHIEIISHIVSILSNLFLSSVPLYSKVLRYRPLYSIESPSPS